jgi:hypothetical protein
MEKWVKPQTTRRYLHPPRAERMFTLWPEGKIIFGENIYQDIIGGSGSPTYLNLVSSGLWLIHSKYGRKFDFRKTENIIQTDGAPIHGIVNRFGGFKMELEAFCNIGRKPTCFIRIRLTNEAPYTATERLGLVVRTGKEKQLVYGSPDCYATHDPELAAFCAQPVSFTEKDGVLRDGEVFLTSRFSQPTEFDPAAGILWCKPVLAAGEIAEWILSFGKGDLFTFDYEEEKQKTLLWWQTELARMQNIPAALRENGEAMTMIRHLTAQMLQCHSCYVGRDYFFLRQGGLQRLVWPWDAAPAIEALGRLGYDDYMEDIFHYYFDLRLKSDGELDNIGEFWACNTACALYSLTTRCMQTGDRSFWQRYRDKAFLAFDWICRKRAEAQDGNGEYAGLFPSLRGCDWDHTFQAWGTTDLWNLFGIEALAKAAEHFDDPRAADVRKEYDDYFAVMKRLLRPYEEEAKVTGLLRLPLCPDGNDKALLEDFHPYLVHGVFVWSGLVDDGDIEKVYRWQVAHGMAKNGLHGHMPYRDGNTHIWYTSYTDYYWFRTRLRRGERSIARQIIQAQVDYAMTPEYYMAERYCDNDPYFVPWSPNCSASGRLMNMLLDFCKEE